MASYDRLIRKKGLIIPIGYKVYGPDPAYLQPVMKEFEALRMVREFIEKGYSWRSVHPWFIKVTGRDCSMEGLRIAVKARAPREPVPGNPLGGVEKPEQPKSNAGRPVDIEAPEKTKEYHVSRKEAAKRAIKRKVTEASKELEKIAKKKDNLQQRINKKKEALKQAEKVTDGKVNIITDEQLAMNPPSVQKHLTEDRPIIFAPNPGPQTQFLAATEKEVFYGGARGGGKSYSLLVDPLRYCHREAHRALILRRTMPELRDLISHSKRIYPKAFPGAKWREQEKEWNFPSGARIEFGYAETTDDALRYQGQSYTWIGVDELPQYPEPKIWNDLRGSLRSVDPEIPEFMRATGNPGNVGSDWVKEMFINPAPPNTRFEVEVELDDGTMSSFTRRFIPAKLMDNPYLMRTNSYRTMLASLPEIQRKQWLEGDWDAWDGAAFPDFRRDVHVIAPFDVPSTWIRFRSCDWGYSTAFCVLWFAVDYDDNLYVYREFYGNKLTADVFAQRVVQMEQKERIHYGVMDSSVWAKRGDIGPGIPEEMAKHGLRWRPSDRSPNSRKNGKMEVHRRLRIDEVTLKPRLYIFNTCTNLIRDLPTLPLDEHDPEDVDTDHPRDHSYDALRYGVMSRPLSPARIDWASAVSEDLRSMPTDGVFGY